MKLTFFLLLLSLSVSAQKINLTGTWRFAIDREEKGVAEKWFNRSLPETITLPGSMAERGKGDDITLQTKWTGSIYDSSFFFRPSLAKYRTASNLKIPFWLTPAKHYVGSAWYQKEIDIPANWKERSIKLVLERAHIETMVWIDDKLIGTNNSLSAAHCYEINNINPGKHRLTIRVNNSITDRNVGPDSHSVSDHTQGNWNGIVGKIYMEPMRAIRMTDMQVFPDIKSKTALVKFTVVNSGPAISAAITVQAKSFNSRAIHETAPAFDRFNLKASDTSRVQVLLPMGEDMLLWDEFEPNLYRMHAYLDAGAHADTLQRQFGMREFTIEGTRFLVNGRPTFLRGTLNNCEFPWTGYPAMDEQAWLRIFRTAKEYGLNHMRFHSWCPPEAAFIAADRAGFYLQPEAPTWPNHGTSVGDGRFIDQYIYDETERISIDYGNYASFCMLAAGNEPAGKNQAAYLARFVNYWKAKDKRRVYTGASVAMSWPLVPENEYMVKSGPRGLKWVDAEPGNNSDYLAAIKDFHVPYVTHELGQWCVFPNFDEIKKYTGVYRARNFELFKQDLVDHGMGDRARDFFLASGKLQALCYKAEIETDLRTNGLAGFQLLGLQDFPGQGTALVGVLDAFWEGKPYITARQYSRFCNASVVLARMDKFVFTNNEQLEAKLELFNFGKMALDNVTVTWTVKDSKGGIEKSGNFPPQRFTLGAGQPIGQLNITLNEFAKAGQYKLEVGIDKTLIYNDWDFWVYPATTPAVKDDDIYYCTTLDEQAMQQLQKGGKVFLDASGKVVKGKEVEMYFTPAFWNTSWFKMRPPHVTGLYIKNDHAAFTDFPTEFHSNYQWWSIANKAQVMHLEDFPAGFQPLVQPIDTWFMNRKLALIFEAKVGNGKLLVSSAPISDTAGSPAARQLYYSLKKYMASDSFNPTAPVDANSIKDLFITPSREQWDSFTKDSPDELKPIKNK